MSNSSVWTPVELEENVYIETHDSLCDDESYPCDKDYFELLFPGYNFEFNLSVAYMVPNLIVLLILSLANITGKYSWRIYGGFAVFGLTFFFIPFVDDSTAKSVGFGITMAAAAMFGLIDAIAQGALYGLAGVYPPEATQALVSGSGATGLIISLVRLITKGALPDTADGLRQSAILYFVFSALFMVICMITFWRLRRSLQSQYIMRRLASEKIYLPALSVLYNYFVTLFLFPGLVSIIPSQRDQWDWFPVILITCFNIGDFVGKSTPKCILDRWNDNMSYVGTFARTAFIILLFLCVKPRLFQHDGWPITFVILFAITNGFYGAKLMMIGPGKVEITSLVLGLTVGALCGRIIPAVLH
ncbi:hypothetical protein PROFUN_14656 [Planoprotostelium fungivorum]|uniref:Uncharacterized protein n=1 Tax=Planoprotostelium fungivorum TaxID=1890364 RepID=A0A2P6MMR7_9EUKA|nr:hypothetical protein PROFUN_14656 [Planoprotostelium fungivorum]